MCTVCLPLQPVKNHAEYKRKNIIVTVKPCADNVMVLAALLLQHLDELV